MRDFLQRQGNEGAQGTGNKVTDQEASFAEAVAARGFSFQAKGTNPSNGLYYAYQLKGTQQDGDFGLRLYKDGAIVDEIIVDLKHTQSKTFYLNDGWFQKGVFYVVTWNQGTAKKPVWKTHIALGEDIPSEEENIFMTALQEFKRDKNTNTKKVGSLRPYVRFANQYSCERFPDSNHFESVTRSLSA